MGVLHKTTFSSALSALNIQFFEWGFQYQTFSILSPSNRCALGECMPKFFEAVSFDRGRSHITSAKMGVSWTSLPSSVSNGQLLDLEIFFCPVSLLLYIRD